MIEQFFGWIAQAITAGVDILGQFVNNSITGDFMKLFLAVFAFVMVWKYVIAPLTHGGSDTVKDSKRNKNE